MNLIGPKDSNMAEKNLYNALHALLVRDTQQQSDRDFPRMSIRGGFGDGSKMASHEAIGNLVIQLVISYTQSGIDILNLGGRVTASRRPATATLSSSSLRTSDGSKSPTPSRT